jgi:hypothetical protein
LRNFFRQIRAVQLIPILRWSIYKSTMCAILSANKIFLIFVWMCCSHYCVSSHYWFAHLSSGVKYLEFTKLFRFANINYLCFAIWSNFSVRKKTPSAWTKVKVCVILYLICEELIICLKITRNPFSWLFSL